MKRLILATILVSTTANAQTRPEPEQHQLKVFGISFLDPLPQNECTYVRIGRSISYNPPRETSCFEFWDDKLKGSGKIPTNATLSIQYPFDQRPQLATAGVVVVGILDNVVQSISFNTHGLGSAESDLKVLSDKFGVPTEAEHPTVQNRLGATFVNTTAHWNLAGGVTVDFDATADDLDTGFVMIQTAAASEYRKAALDKLNSKQTEL